MEETSLEDFLDGGTTDEDGDSATPEPAAADASAGDAAPDRTVETPADGLESPTVTAAWSPDGLACADCGARVAWRWGTEAGLVCRDCKDW